MDFSVLGEFWVVTLIYEENLNGGIRIYSFFGFWAWVHVRMGGGGTTVRSPGCLEELLTFIGVGFVDF
jgi:hypothetical protein